MEIQMFQKGCRVPHPSSSICELITPGTILHNAYAVRERKYAVWVKLSLPCFAMMSEQDFRKKPNALAHLVHACHADIDSNF